MDALALNYDGFAIKIFIHSKNNIAFSFTNNKNPVEYLTIINKTELDKKTNHKICTESQEKVVEIFKGMVKDSLLTIERNDDYLLTTWNMYFTSALFVEFDIQIPKIKDERAKETQQKETNKKDPLSLSKSTANKFSSKTKSISDPLAKSSPSLSGNKNLSKNLLEEVNQLKKQIQNDEKEYKQEVKILNETISELKKQILSVKNSLNMGSVDAIMNELARSDMDFLELKNTKAQFMDLKLETKGLYTAYNNAVQEQNNSRKSSNNQNDLYNSDNRKYSENENKKEEKKKEEAINPAKLNKDPLSALTGNANAIDPLGGIGFAIKPKKLKNMYGLTTSIMNSVADADKLRTLLFPNRNIKFDLLYKGTRDGDNADVFRQKVGERVPTLILMKTAKNKKFGGYSETSWQIKGNCSFKRDENAFLFSFDKNKKYKATNPDKAILCIPSCLVCFSTSDFYVPNGYLKNTGNEKKIKDAFDSKDLDLTTEEKFKIGEMEVYQVLFE